MLCDFFIFFKQVCCQHREDWLWRWESVDPLSSVEPSLWWMVWLDKSLSETCRENPAEEAGPEWRLLSTCKLTFRYILWSVSHRKFYFLRCLLLESGSWSASLKSRVLIAFNEAPFAVFVLEVRDSSNKNLTAYTKMFFSSRAFT